MSDNLHRIEFIPISTCLCLAAMSDPRDPFSEDRSTPPKCCIPVATISSSGVSLGHLDSLQTGAGYQSEEHKENRRPSLGSPCTSALLMFRFHWIPFPNSISPFFGESPQSTPRSLTMHAQTARSARTLRAPSNINHGLVVSNRLGEPNNQRDSSLRSEVFIDRIAVDCCAHRQPLDKAGEQGSDLICRCPFDRSTPPTQPRSPPDPQQPVSPVNRTTQQIFAEDAAIPEQPTKRRSETLDTDHHTPH